jgi:epoxyqueuosine reductase
MIQPVDGTQFKGLLNSRLKDQGFSRVRILSPLPQWKRKEVHPREVINGNRDSLSQGHCDPDFPDRAQSAVMVFFPYYRGDSPDPKRNEGTGTVLDEKSASTMARLAPFARRNNYKETVTRLKQVSSWIRQEKGITKDQVRIFCNSRFPEKQMAWHSGLGFLGKNSLIITPEYGSLGVIGGFFLPFDLPGDKPLESEPYEKCGNCQLCSAACPGGALSGKGGIDKNLCYQYLSTSHEVLPEPVMESWGNILYGCQICQDICPYNRDKPEGVTSDLGELGAGLDPATLLSLSDSEMKFLLKGSVPGASWIKPDCLRRNALLCLPKGKSSREILKSYVLSENPVLAGTASFLSALNPA